MRERWRDWGREMKESGDRGINRQRHKGLEGQRWRARGVGGGELKEWQIVSHLEQICIPETSAVIASTCALHKTVKRLPIKVRCLCCCCWRLDKGTEALCSWQLEPGDTFNTATIIKTYVCTVMANSLSLTAEKAAIVADRQKN